MLICRVLGVVLLLGVLPIAHADGDLDGSRDPGGIERFPHSWIVDYRRDDAIGPRALVVGRVERLRRDVRVDHQLRVDATLDAAIYRIPDGTPVAAVVAHYLPTVEGGLVYRCGGRECGRSSEWANQIYGKSILYGPDANQQYLAWESQGRLISVYVIERGNRRVYASMQVLQPADGATVGANELLARRMAAQGWAVVAGITPRLDGSLPGNAAEVMAALAPQMAELPVGDLHLICHLYGRRPASELLAAAERCATAAARLLAEVVPSVHVEPFAAGPLLPRGAAPAARLELVMPGRLAAAAVGASD